MAGGDDHYDEATRRFFRDIGLSSAQRRMQNLDQQAAKMRFRSRRQGSSAMPSLTQPKRIASSFGANATPRHSIDAMGSVLPVAAEDGLQQPAEQPAMPKGSRLDPVSPIPLSSSGGRANDIQSSSGSPCQKKWLLDERQARMRDELDEARHELKARVQKYREELVEDMRPHEVSLLLRPTTAELEDKKTTHLQSLRRRHHKVVVGADEKEIRKMPNHKLCISDDLKRSLSKMRENLFQRRLNLAIYEKTVGDWAMPQLRAEVRRRGRKEAAKAQEQQRKPEAGAAAPGVQVPSHSEPSASATAADISSPGGPATVAPVAAASLAAPPLLEGREEPVPA